MAAPLTKALPKTALPSVGFSVFTLSHYLEKTNTALLLHETDERGLATATHPKLS
jgi:hypothetical protein